MTVLTSPYVPSFLMAALSGSRPLTLTFSEVSDTNIQSTSSFAYDPLDSPLKSTQQLNVDWSQFEAHTFFMNAEAKVNIAFDQIINGFPFDGTRLEAETFFEGLSGFDKWVFDQFPVFRGELLFSSSVVGDTSPASGTYVVVNDVAGGLFPSLAKNPTGESVVNPINTSLSVEMQLFIPSGSQTTGYQTVCQKLSGSTQGFAFFLSPSKATETYVTGTMCVISGTANMSVSALLAKGQFNHACMTLNRDNGVHYLEAFNNAASVAVSPTRTNIGFMDISGVPFIIGSGSVVLGIVTPTQTLSGVIDELRVFHSARTPQLQALFASKPLFATDDLVLYYRFNEPPKQLGSSATDTVNSIVIDSSGNAVHALITNFTSSLRLNAAADPLSNMTYERNETAPVLFPMHPDVVTLNTTLLTSASLYDQENPNIITRLVPPHYLQEGAYRDGFVEPEGLGGQSYGGSGLPGTGQLGNVQLMLSLLYTWARFFDEMKLYVDAFSKLRTVDYDTDDTVPDNFLLSLVKQFGFHLPPMFNDATLEQYVRAENIAQTISNTNISLRDVQTQLLRRVLKNIPNVLRSKGTQHSIKAFLRSVGIDPDNNVRIREFGGPTEQQLSCARETKRDVGTMVKFISSSYVVSPFLTASRVEPGFPAPVGTFTKGVSNNVSDGLLTSGSWTWEGVVKYLPPINTRLTSLTQSLVRLCIVSGTVTSSVTSANVDQSSNVGLIANLVAISSSLYPRLTLYMHPSNNSSEPTLALTLSASVPNGIFDGDKWNVSFGIIRGDAFGSRVSSSVFLRLATQDGGDISQFISSSAYFDPTPSSGKNVLRVQSASMNASGAFLSVGQSQTIPVGSGLLYLNNSTVNQEARITNFDGSMSNFRFWSKALTETEWREHVRNYKSTGVETPATNWNYEHVATGSWERLRLSSMQKQTVRRANATASLGTLGALSLLDFSENGFHMTGSGFPIDVDSVLAELFDYSYVSPYFDEASTNQKVRVRGYQNVGLVQTTPWAGVAPVYDVLRSERPTDDVRFAVEFSLIDALNRDMVTMFSTLDALDNAFGNPELAFSPDYPLVERLRDTYFNRIKQKLNFRAFFEFYRWFDTSIGSFIEQLLPRKTAFKGTNFVIESHMLERHKVQYNWSDMYVDEANKARIDDAIFLEQIEGAVRKY